MKDSHTLLEQTKKAPGALFNCCVFRLQARSNPAEAIGIRWGEPWTHRPSVLKCHILKINQMDVDIALTLSKNQQADHVPRHTLCQLHEGSPAVWWPLLCVMASTIKDMIRHGQIMPCNANENRAASKGDGWKAC